MRCGLCGIGRAGVVAVGQAVVVGIGIRFPTAAGARIGLCGIGRAAVVAVGQAVVVGIGIRFPTAASARIGLCGIAGADVTGITGAVTIGIVLIGIECTGTVVDVAADTVAIDVVVGIVWTGFAGGAIRLQGHLDRRRHRIVREERDRQIERRILERFARLESGDESRVCAAASLITMDVDLLSISQIERSVIADAPAVGDVVELV